MILLLCTDGKNSILHKTFNVYFLMKRYTRKGRWNDVLYKGDPNYNPNLTLEREDFSIRI